MDIDGFLRRTGKKQRELASELGISPAMVNALKKGRTDTSATICRKLLLSGMTVEELFGSEVWELVKARALGESGKIVLGQDECMRIVAAGLASMRDKSR